MLKRESYHESIFLYFRIVYYKIHKHLIQFIKKIIDIHIKGIFIINFEYIQLMTNLFITYVIIFVEDKFFIPHGFISLATRTTSILSWILENLL